MLCASLVAFACAPGHTITFVIEPVATLEEAFQRLPGEAREGSVVLLSGNAESWAERWRLLEGAKRTLDVAYFILEDDPFGMAFLGHLYERALDGVKVRLLLDARGSGDIATPWLGRDYLQELAATGNVTIHIYNPPLMRVSDSFLSMSLVPAIASNHDKIIIADEERAIVGGRNITRLYFVDNSEIPTATLDADVLLEGDVLVGELTRLFLDEFWAERREPILPDEINLAPRGPELSFHYHAMDAFVRGRPLRAGSALLREADANDHGPLVMPWVPRRELRPYLDELAGYRSVYGVLNGDRGRRHRAGVKLLRSGSRATDFDLDVAGGVLQALEGAEREVSIQTPYFVLTWDVIQVLEDLARRGVEIVVLTNSPRSSDNAASQALFVEEWPEIMARVPTLRMFAVASPQLMHAKRVVLDGKLTLVGTYNLDPLSSRVNSEVMAAIWSEGFARENLDEMNARLGEADVFEYTIARDESGAALRHPPGHPDAGRVVVVTGPRDHTPADDYDRLLVLKDVIMRFSGLLEVQPVVW